MTDFNRARELRRNMTDVERFVWSRLRGRRFAGCKFRRQMPLGRYIVDFVCLDCRLIVELDGGQHAEQVQYDVARTAWLNGQGFEVLRFWNHEVWEDWEVIEEVIWRRLQADKTPSPPTPLPQGERGG
jgi:very-short-patch-repair endonuclease